MEIEQVQRVPPAVALLEEIDKRARSPLMMAGGLGQVLGMLRAYIAQQEAERVEVRAALGLLACRYLRDTSLSEVQQQALTKMQAWAKEGL